MAKHTDHTNAPLRPWRSRMAVKTSGAAHPSLVYVGSSPKKREEGELQGFKTYRDTQQLTDRCTTAC
eukprot:31111-Eustigmatos_ZCMA.PRE.1